MKLKGKLGSGPKGVDDLCFHTYGEFSPPPSSPPSYPPPPSLRAHISAWRPISQPGGPNLSLEAQIPSDWNPGLGVGIWAMRVGFGPQDWDLCLEAGIWASRLRYRPGGWGEGGTEKEKEKEEKIPHMCESIGHRPQDFFHDFQKATFLRFITPFVNELTENF